MSEAHYGPAYFAWHNSVSEVGATLNQYKFRDWIGPGDTVLDFGCGGGALLAALPGTRKIGVEISDQARSAAAERGIETFRTLADIPDGSVDVVISNHALEHVERPADELREIRRVLRAGGAAVLVVPIDDWRNERHPDPADPNHHLYTWTPMMFATLLGEAGFRVESCSVLTHSWRRKFLLLHRVLPRPVYNVAAWMLAVATRSRQIHAVAR